MTRVGATSRIAQDFVLSAHRKGRTFGLYARRPEAVAAFLAAHGLPAAWARGTLEDFARAKSPFAGIVNCVGVGDPARARAMGADIFAATSSSDDLALAHLGHFPQVPYLFLSSGAVYGAAFDRPADADTHARLPVNALGAQDQYGIAKLHAEARHRALTGRTIIDLRVFNYVSRTLDCDARFLITDMVRAIRDSRVFETTDQPLVRDYLHPEDFCALALACLKAPAGTNMAVDAYSRAPIDKRALLALMAAEFGLRHRFVAAAAAVNATGAKPFYYSTSRAAAALGYAPTRSSAEAIREEVGAILGRAAPAPLMAASC